MPLDRGAAVAVPGTTAFYDSGRLYAIRRELSRRSFILLREEIPPREYFCHLSFLPLSALPTGLRAIWGLEL